MRESERSITSLATSRTIGLLAALAVLTAGCAVREPVEPEPAAADTRPAAVDRSTATLYRVDAGASELRVYVYRAGPLARIGHNHVIATRQLEGNIWYRDRSGRTAFSIAFPVESLRVDEPRLRADAGPDFAGEIPPEDIAGTRRNLLGEAVLDAANHPRVSAELVRASGNPPALTVTAAVTIRGQRRLVEFPATVELRGERMLAEGETTVSQARLGLEPFSVMGGALSVAEDIGLAYRIEAVRDGG